MSRPPALPTANRRRQTHWQLILWTTIPPLCIIVLLVLAVIRYDQKLSAEIEALREERARVVAEMEAEGLPLSDEAWAERHPTPLPEENAAHIYTQAFASLVAISPQLIFDVPFVGEMEPLAPGEAYTTVSMDAMRAYVATNQFALALADSAAGFDRAQFERYGTVEGETTARIIAKALVALLSLRIEMMGIDGETSGLEDAIRSLHAAVQMLDESPDFIDNLSAFRMRREYATLLSRLYARQSPTITVLETVDDLAWRKSPEQLFIWNTAYGAGRTEFPEHAGMFLLLEDKRLFFPFPDRYKDRWVERIMEKYWLLDLNYRRSVLESMDAIAKDVAPTLDALKAGYESEVPKGFDIFDIPITLELIWSARAHDRMLALANGIERYRLEQGALPERVEDLSPTVLDAIPADPYDGAPVRYQRRDGGYLTYCVGINLADDGGAAYTKRTQQIEKGDVVMGVYERDESPTTE